MSRVVTSFFYLRFVMVTMSEQNSSSRQNGGGKNSPDFVTPSGSSRPPNQHSDVLDEGECIKLRQFNEAPPDAPDEQLLIDIFNEVQEYVAAEMAKRKRTKVLKVPLISSTPPMLILAVDFVFTPYTDFYGRSHLDRGPELLRPR
jgi:hypothetical protein